jgi:Leucine-rich repeat (LRR) protein
VLPDAVMQKKRLTNNSKVPLFLSTLSTNLLLDKLTDENTIPTPIIPLSETPLVPTNNVEESTEVQEESTTSDNAYKHRDEWLDDSLSVESNNNFRILIQRCFERAKRYSKNLDVITFAKIDKRDVLPDRREAVSLDMSSKMLTKLPQFLIDCTLIAQLDFSNNFLTTIPDWLGSTMKNLLDANLSNNYLTSLPPSFSCLKLQRLNLSSNKFEYIPYAVLQISTLTSLDVSHNRLLVLPYGLSNLKLSLAELNFAYNNIIEVPDVLLSLRKLRAMKSNENKFYSYTVNDVISKLYVEEFKTNITAPVTGKLFITRY